MLADSTQGLRYRKTCRQKILLTQNIQKQMSFEQILACSGQIGRDRLDSLNRVRWETIAGMSVGGTKRAGWGQVRQRRDKSGGVRAGRTSNEKRRGSHKSTAAWGKGALVSAPARLLAWAGNVAFGDVLAGDNMVFHWHQGLHFLFVRAVFNKASGVETAAVWRINRAWQITL